MSEQEKIQVQINTLKAVLNQTPSGKQISKRKIQLTISKLEKKDEYFRLQSLPE